MNPFANAAAQLQRRAIGPTDARGDMTWYGQRGWSVVHGTKRDAPRSFEELVIQGFRRNPVVSACTREIVTSLSEAPVYAYKKSDGEWVRSAGHRAELLWETPNGRDSYVEFIERSGQHFLLGGNTFLEKRRVGSGLVDSLIPIWPHEVLSVDVDEDTIPLRYKVRDRNNPAKWHWVDADDMVHIPDLDPLNHVFGLPRLLAGGMEISTDNEASQYVSEILHNHGSPGLVVSTEPRANTDAIKRAERKWDDKFGRGNRGKVAFVPGGRMVKEIGFSLKELEFPSLRALTREGICALMGVDPLLVSVASAARKGSSLSGNEYEAALRRLWVQTVIPLIRRYESALNMQLSPEFGDTYMFFELEEIAALQENRDEAVARGKEMQETGAFTREEIRVETGHDPEPSPTDKSPYIRPFNVIATPQEGDGEPSDDTVEVGTDGLPDGEDEIRGHVPRFVLGPGVDRDEAWKSFDAFARSQEPEYRLQAERQLRREDEEIVILARTVLEDHKSGNGTPPPGKAPAPARPSESGAGGAADVATKQGVTEESLKAFYRALGDRYTEYHAQWFERFRALTTRTSELVASTIAGDIGAELNVSFSVLDPNFQAFISTTTNRLAGNVTEASFRAITSAIEEGVLAGEGTNALADRVHRVFGEGYRRDGVQILNATQRARLIARTETTTAANGASLWTMRQTGLEWWKSWITQGDDRVRDDHAAMEGERVDLDAEFSNGLDGPGEPNCRCTLLYDIKKPDEIDDTRADVIQLHRMARRARWREAA